MRWDRERVGTACVPGGAPLNAMGERDVEGMAGEAQW